MKFRHTLAILAFAPLLTGCGGGGSSSSGPSSAVVTYAVDGAETARLMSLAGQCAAGYANGGVTGVITVVGAPGISPTTTVTVNGTTTTTTVNYGSGISSGGETISGSFTVVFNTANNTGTITFTNFSVTTAANLETVAGTVDFVITPGSNGSNSEAVSNNLTVVDGGQTYRLVGTFTADSTTSSGLVEIPTADETLTAPQGVLIETVNDLTFDPTTHHADGGSIQSTYTPSESPIAISILITFSSQTPTNRMVGVSVDGSPSTQVQVPTSNL